MGVVSLRVVTNHYSEESMKKSYWLLVFIISHVFCRIFLDRFKQDYDSQIFAGIHWLGWDWELERLVGTIFIWLLVYCLYRGAKEGDLG